MPFSYIIIIDKVDSLCGSCHWIVYNQQDIIQHVYDHKSNEMDIDYPV